MPGLGYARGLREKVGHDLLVLPSVTAAIFDDARRILLLRHAEGGVWVAPGGAVEPDEDPADAVVREVWEETGLVVEPVRLRGVFGGPEFRVRYANGDETAYVMSVFECRPVSGRARPDGRESLELRWVAEADLGGLALARWARIVLPELLDERGGGGFRPPRWTPPDRAT